MNRWTIGITLLLCLLFLNSLHSLTVSDLVRDPVYGDLLNLNKTYSALYGRSLTDDVLVSIFQDAVKPEEARTFDYYADLSYQERYFLYQRLKIGGPLPHLINFITPGLGNLIALTRKNDLFNGDYANAWVAGNIILLPFGAASTLFGLPSFVAFLFQGGGEFGFNLMLGGAHLLIYLVSEVQYLINARNYNRILKESLLSDKDTPGLSLLVPHLSGDLQAFNLGVHLVHYAF